MHEKKSNGGKEYGYRYNYVDVLSDYIGIGIVIIMIIVILNTGSITTAADNTRTPPIPFPPSIPLLALLPLLLFMLMLIVVE